MTPTPPLRKRLVAPLCPTETPSLGTTEKPHVKQSDLIKGAILIRVYPDWLGGLWMAILDVTDVEGDNNGAYWAPGIQPPVLIPEASIRAIQDAQGPPPPPASPLLLPSKGEPIAVPRQGLDFPLR